MPRAATPPSRLVAANTLRLGFLAAAAAALFTAVPQQAAASLGVECSVVFAVADVGVLGSVSWNVDYQATSGAIVGHGDDVDCSPIADVTLSAFHDDDRHGILGAAVVANPGVTTPRDLVSCSFRGPLLPKQNEFSITVTDASDGDVTPIEPLPDVSISALDCSVITDLTTTTFVSTSTSFTTTTTTTSSTSSTTTTLGEPDCRDWEVTLRLDESSAPVGALQFAIGYEGVNGDFAGRGAEVECEGLAAGALVEANDDDAMRALTLGIVSQAGVGAPVDLAACRINTPAGVVPGPDDLSFSVEESLGVDSEAVEASISASFLLNDTEAFCERRCGDGYVAASEACDDGNDSNHDQCLNDCRIATCGDGYVNGATENCDDANDDDTDGCPGSCRVAYCGDGYVHAGVEQCDDANVSNDDACVAGCKAARCGDGYLQVGVEECDDANDWDGDSCVGSCKLATCGDGFVDFSSEECDDANSIDGDACENSCRVTRTCGDPIEDGRVTAGDSLQTLRRAVDLDVECPDWTCDVNGDGHVTTLDALSVLRTSVGLQATMNCSEPDSIVVRYIGAASLVHLTLRVDFGDNSATAAGDGAAVECEGLVGNGSSAAFEKLDDGRLYADLVWKKPGVTGQVSVLRCQLAEAGLFDDFDFSVEYLGGGLASGGVPVPYQVQLRAVPY